MSWKEFEDRRRRDRERETGAAQSSTADRHLELCALVFNSGHGRELLALWRAEIVARRTGRDISEAALRHCEAQRQFVLQIEDMRDAGLEAMAQKSKPKS